MRWRRVSVPDTDRRLRDIQFPRPDKGIGRLSENQPAGWGEVYRARDTKLGSRRRDQDPARLVCRRPRIASARFQREAQDARGAEPSEHRRDLRLERGRDAPW